MYNKRAARINIVLHFGLIVSCRAKANVYRLVKLLRLDDKRVAEYNIERILYINKQKGIVYA